MPLSSASVVKGVKMLPEKVDLTYDQIQALKSSIQDSNLSIEDIALIKGLIDFNGWLQQQLLERKISIKRLKMLIFGEPQSKSKRSKSKPSTNTSRNQNNVYSSNDDIANKGTEGDLDTAKAKNGRLSHQHYLNSEKVTIKHHQYKTGDLCPTQCGGRLWTAIPGIVIKVSGQGFAKATQSRICSNSNYLHD